MIRTSLPCSLSILLNLYESFLFIYLIINLVMVPAKSLFTSRKWLPLLYNIFQGNRYFLVNNDWGSCFCLVYYCWRSYYSEWVNVHRYTGFGTADAKTHVYNFEDKLFLRYPCLLNEILVYISFPVLNPSLKGKTKP